MELKLYKNFPINDYANQVYYSSKSERDNAFDNYEDRTIQELASCDKTKQQIRLNVSYYVGNQYNYGCIVENNKRYYIFINKVEWKSNLNTVILHYSYDYWQTYCYQIELKESFVEREHVEDDTYGKHIIDEGLPIDEYKVQSSKVIDGDCDGMYFCVCASDFDGVISSTPVVPGSGLPGDSIGGSCQPSKYEYSTMIVYSASLERINEVINAMVINNKIDGISGLYSVPKVAIPEEISENGYYVPAEELIETMIPYVGVNNKNPIMLEWDIHRPHTIDGYTPVNNKCYTYPYCFANITNNNGSSIYGQFELADDKETVKFRYYFPCIQGQTSFGYLEDYDGVQKNFDKSIQGQTNIEIPFVTNSFSAYMSAHQNAIANQYYTIDRNKDFAVVKSGINGITGVIGNALSGNIGGIVDSGINSVMGMAEANLNAYNQREAINSALADQQSKADVSHGAYTGIGSIICGQIGFKGQLITITAENIKMIDDYFSMFGYKVNTIKVPQFNSRNYWNYIKTSGVNMIGNVPQDAISVIKQMFDNGVTMWHSLNYMYKYDEYKRLNV